MNDILLVDYDGSLRSPRTAAEYLALQRLAEIDPDIFWNIEDVIAEINDHSEDEFLK